MCPAPVEDRWETKENANEQNSDSGAIAEEQEERVLSAGLFPPEATPGSGSSSTEAQEDREAREEDMEEDYDSLNRGSTAAASSSIPQRPDAAVRDGDGSSQSACEDKQQETEFSFEETLFVFDWDDTLLPSTWLQRQGLRLDDGSSVSDWHKGQLLQVANTAIELLCNAKRSGTVVLVTNAERGWIELSCLKFLPSLLPILENVKAVSARTSFETRSVTSPLEWKVRAFAREINGIWGQESPHRLESRKNIFSVGDSVHEREAMFRATAKVQECRSKSLKFVERPDITQICKQHTLVNGCFDRVLHHDGNLDLCIKCT